MPAITALTLYDVEEELQALADTEDLVETQQETEFLERLADALDTAKIKRDRVAHTILAAEQMQAQCKAEIARLAALKDRFASIEFRLRRYVVRVIRSFGKDPKGKYRKLQGETTMMYLRALPTSVDVLDDAVLAPRFKNVIIEVEQDYWLQLQADHPELRDVTPKAVTVDKERIREALEAGEEVRGADLKLSGHDYSLTVK